MNNDHNTYDSSTLERVISIIRAQHGKATCRQLGERIGRSTTQAWLLLSSNGLPTRLYRESLQRIEERIRTEGKGLTLTELYERFGSTWANPGSFYHYLNDRGIQPARAARTPTTPKTPDASLSLSKHRPLHPLFGREGLLDDRDEIIVSAEKEAEIAEAKAKQNPTLLHKESFKENQHNF